MKTSDCNLKEGMKDSSPSSLDPPPPYCFCMTHLREDSVMLCFSKTIFVKRFLVDLVLAPSFPLLDSLRASFGVT